MCATSSERRRSHGFTLPELIAILVVVGVLAAVAVPKLDMGSGLRHEAWRDEVVSALRHARHTAVSHRRLVCASVEASRVKLTIAAVNPASACSAGLPAPDGGADFATAPGGASASVAPTGLLYFQPSGRVTSDAGGVTASDRSIAISGGVAAVTVVGETGHVR